MYSNKFSGFSYIDKLFIFKFIIKCNIIPNNIIIFNQHRLKTNIKWVR